MPSVLLRNLSRDNICEPPSGTSRRSWEEGANECHPTCRPRPATTSVLSRESFGTHGWKGAKAFRTARHHRIVQARPKSELSHTRLDNLDPAPTPNIPGRG